MHSSIILAGDPKQLDAVTKSANAAELGLKTSFMEHLANMPRYKKHEKFGYDSRYITQLVKNYRSHAAILRFPNTMFYGSSLQALAPPGIVQLTVNCFEIGRFISNWHYLNFNWIPYFCFVEITDWYKNSNLLPSKQFPIIFKSVNGRCQSSYQDTRYQCKFFIAHLRSNTIFLLLMSRTIHQCR